MASYIGRTLGDGETVIIRERFPTIYTLTAWAFLLVPLIGLIAAYGYGRQDPANATVGNGWAIAFLVLLAVGLFFAARMLIRKWTTEIGVTSHRFVEKYGLVAIHSNEIALPNIEGVKMRQSLWGRLFNYGTVKIEGTGVDSVTTPPIADPVGFVRAIQTAKEHLAGRPAP